MIICQLKQSKRAETSSLNIAALKGRNILEKGDTLRKGRGRLPYFAKPFNPCK